MTSIIRNSFAPIEYTILRTKELLEKFFGNTRCYDTLYDIFKPSDIAQRQTLKELEIFINENNEKYKLDRLLSERSLVYADNEISTEIAKNISKFVCDTV